MHNIAIHRKNTTPVDIATSHSPHSRLETLEIGESGEFGERDAEWDEFLALAQPRPPGDAEPGTRWLRTPVMLSY